MYGFQDEASGNWVLHIFTFTQYIFYDWFANEIYNIYIINAFYVSRHQNIFDVKMVVELCMIMDEY